MARPRAGRYLGQTRTLKIRLASPFSGQASGFKCQASAYTPFPIDSLFETETQSVTCLTKDAYQCAMLRGQNVHLGCLLGPRTPFILEFLVSILVGIPVGVVRRLGVAPSHMRKEHCRVGYSRPPSVVPSPPSYSVALALLRHSVLLSEVELPEEDPSIFCRNFHQQVCPLRAHTVIGVWTIPSHEEGIAQFWIFHDPRSFITRLCFNLATHVLTSSDVSEEGISDMKGHKLSSRS